MIREEDYRHFICVVAGDNPEELMKEFEGKKFAYHCKPVLVSRPFETKDGRTGYSFKKSEINWDKAHMASTELFKKVWDLANGAEALTAEDKSIKEMLFDKSYYLEKFQDKETFVSSNCAFWGYAFLSDMTGWMDITSVDGDLYVWSSNFYDLFIKTLKDETLITIYECTKKISED